MWEYKSPFLWFYPFIYNKPYQLECAMFIGEEEQWKWRWCTLSHELVWHFTSTLFSFLPPSPSPFLPLPISPPPPTLSPLPFHLSPLSFLFSSCFRLSLFLVERKNGVWCGIYTWIDAIKTVWVWEALTRYTMTNNALKRANRLV